MRGAASPSRQQPSSSSSRRRSKKKFNNKLHKLSNNANNNKLNNPNKLNVNKRKYQLRIHGYLLLLQQHPSTDEEQASRHCSLGLFFHALAVAAAAAAAAAAAPREIC
mmetsp:Transcript_12280/g.18618  ORF Transcript_12280/g.18618 Transcript_12280/m.18618 type:complete len:108 (+) Transcript_12280:171-494(+)